jgi:hypothetical protein
MRLQDATPGILEFTGIVAPIHGIKCLFASMQSQTVRYTQR